MTEFCRFSDESINPQLVGGIYTVTISEGITGTVHCVGNTMERDIVYTNMSFCHWDGWCPERRQCPVCSRIVKIFVQESSERDL